MLTTHNFADHAWAQLQPGQKKLAEKARDKLRSLHQSPSSGRTTALGRKVEKPGTEKPGGPSGQTEDCEHNKKHANK